ncbi:MAG: putative bacteriophage protein [Phenylobacterium sp.]|nr:putative bacteriophage protein [Phenylobacterium sp.]
MTAYTTRAPAGFPGRVSRSDSLTVQQDIIDSGTPPNIYGGAVKLVSGKLQPVASGDAGTVVVGFLVSPYPTQNNAAGGGAATPAASGIADRLRRGFMTVTLAKGTAAKGGGVFVVTTAGGTVVVGDIVTSASPAGGGTGVAITGAFFEGPADANGIVEISYNI